MEPGRQFLHLFHGTTADHTAAIESKGLDPNDMGHVYATPHEDVAWRYAETRAAANGDEAPAVVSFRAHPDQVLDGARAGEVIHRGRVAPSAITNIVHDY